MVRWYYGMTYSRWLMMVRWYYGMTYPPWLMMVRWYFGMTYPPWLMIGTVLRHDRGVNMGGHNATTKWGQKWVKIGGFWGVFWGVFWGLFWPPRDPPPGAPRDPPGGRFSAPPKIGQKSGIFFRGPDWPFLPLNSRKNTKIVKKSEKSGVPFCPDWESY